MPNSVYIHIPFCKSKCHYCSFISFNKLELKNDYLKSLGYEIEHIYKGEELKTLYIGGGTPSNLTPQETEKIINNFNTSKDTEITMELNPEESNYEYLKSLYKVGINRISIGAQTFNDKILKLINRRHNSEQIIDVVKNSQKAGFDNISLDFIYGLPNQSEEEFYDNLKQAINLDIKHISLYGLSIEHNCYFAKHPPDDLPDDEQQADMYLGSINLLEKHNYKQYEFSNFCIKGYESKHNLNYWNCEEYYGFGTASHGYVNNTRYNKPETVEEYIKNPLLRLNEHVLTLQEKLEEEIFLGLRKTEGIDINRINMKYNIDFNKKYSRIIKKYTDLNLLIETSKGYKLHPNGILLSNTILSEFLE